MKHHPGLVILDAHATVQHCRGCYYFCLLPLHLSFVWQVFRGVSQLLEGTNQPSLSTIQMGPTNAKNVRSFRSTLALLNFILYP